MCKTIKQKVQFAAPPKAVYELLTDSKKHRAFSGLAANFSKHIGGKFTAYGDHIKGVIVDGGGVPKDLIPKIEAGWREFYWQRMKKYLQENR